MPLTGYPITDIPPEIRAQAAQVRRVIEPRTAASPILSPAVERATGLSGVQVRALVHALREAGEPICSNSRGYWYARSADELNGTIEHLRQRRNSLGAVLGGLERARVRMVEDANRQPQMSLI